MPYLACNYCHNLITTPREPGSQQPHYKTAAALSTSSRSCQLCKTIAEAAQLHETIGLDAAPQDVQIGLQMKDALRFTSGAVWKYVSGSVDNVVTGAVRNFHFTVILVDEGSEASKAPMWQTSEITFEDRAAFMKTWIQNCDESHEHCQVELKKQPSRLPTRLIEVGTLSRPPRLVESASFEKHQDVRYATLSYCWGPLGTQPVTLKKDTFAQLTDKIPVERLPRTVAQSINLTRELGVPYLWVDAFCIMQDDAEDWAREATRMYEVYAGGTLNIAAAEGKDSHHGLFETMPKEDRHNGLDSEAIGRHDLHPISDVLIRDYACEIRGVEYLSHLVTRGWCFQEAELSQRTVSFVDSQMFWACPSYFYAEAGVNFQAYDTALSKLSFKDQAWRTEEMEQWRGKMMIYSQRQFTFSKDWLPALAGVVQSFQVSYPSKHILACWEESLISDLAWIRAHWGVTDGHGTVMSGVKGVPSWSWLSRFRCVRFSHLWTYMADTDLLATGFDVAQTTKLVVNHTKLVQASIQWTGAPLVSEIASTSMIIEGPVKKMTLRMNPEKLGMRPPHMEFIFDSHFQRPSEQYKCRGQFDNGPLCEFATYTCLLLQSIKMSNELKAEGRRFSHLIEMFLILQEVEDGMYRRVGMAAFRVFYSDQSVFGEGEMKQIRLV